MKPTFSESLLSYKLAFDATLTKLDNYLKERKPSEKYMIITTPGLLIAFLVFTYLFPYAENYEKENRAVLKNVESQISEYNSLLSSVGPIGGNLAESLSIKISEIKKELDAQNTLNSFIDSQIDNNLNFIQFDKKKWSAYIDNIYNLSKTHNINISSSKNQIIGDLSVDTFGKVLQMDINGSGNYEDLMRYLSNIESQPEITEITQLELSAAKKQVLFVLSLIVWGYK